MIYVVSRFQERCESDCAHQPNGDGLWVNKSTACVSLLEPYISSCTEVLVQGL